MRVTKTTWQADDSDVKGIVEGRHTDPFGVLGLHEIAGVWVARAFVPHAESVSARTLDNRMLGELTLRDPAGFFEGEVAIKKLQPVSFHARNSGGDWDVLDP